MYFESLYNENRNAIPSWQGYQYQGEVAMNKYLHYLLNQFQKETPIDDLALIKVEWLEDFVIFEGETAKEIYQVKKTLMKNDYSEVIQNFILQYKILNDKKCKWFLTYDNVANCDLEQIGERDFNEIYESYIYNSVLVELNLLIDNKENLSFWKENLKLRSEIPSQLKNIRGFIRKIMSLYDYCFSNLTKEDCRKFIENHLNHLINSLILNKNEYTIFCSQLCFDKVEISNLKTNSIEVITRLINEGYLSKSDIMTTEDIYKLLNVLVSEKLMAIENKKQDDFIIKFTDIQEIFMCSAKSIGIWKDRVLKAKEEIRNKIAGFCDKCEKKTCVECQITKFLSLDFCELIDHCNLAYPKFDSDKVLDSLTDKVSRLKNVYLANTLVEYKNYLNCVTKSNFVELSTNDKKFFISENMSDDENDNRLELIKNMRSHIAVYKEYENILTKYFDDVIDFEKAKIVMNTEFVTEKTPPTFMEVLPVNFISKRRLEEE